MHRHAAIALLTMLKAWSRPLCACILAALSISCSAATRYKVLSTIFDGVPPPRPPATEPANQAGAAAAPSRLVGPREHGPYAAKLCGACHEAAATNALVAPRDQLCFRCHEIRLDKRYIHGPVAAGGCLVCHDPHSSQYRYLLVSESDSFCFYCHDRATVAAIAGHEGLESGCTGCHDAHSSDRTFLLK